MSCPTLAQTLPTVSSSIITPELATHLKLDVDCVGARFGVSVGYLKFTSQATWNPF